MHDNCYLVVTRKGVKDMKKTAPLLNAGEISIKINIVIPDKAFYQPQFEGILDVPEEMVDKKIQELEFELKRIKSEE